MKINKIALRNFRRLEDVEIGIEDGETVFIGPNNSGKTSATAAFRLFLVSQAFSYHDFSVSKVAAFDQFGAAEGTGEVDPPSIEMDIWFSVDPDIEFGRVSSLVSNLSSNLDEIGIRLKYCVKDAKVLKTDYLSVFPTGEGTAPQKSLSHYLSTTNNLGKHFAIKYYALEEDELEPESVPTALEPAEAKGVLRSLLRVDFVDAQRNIDDQEGGRSNRLSAAFAAFYRKNLEQAEVSKDANRVIDENNKNLTKHYDNHFSDLMTVIKDLGVPSVNDREMRIISSMSPETALKGNTSLLYIDPALNHELPEAYNGLGFKNLIYMAIQISHFYLRWRAMENSRPLCQLIFVEEPEVHLHAQVQQTFVSNIWSIIQRAAKEAGEEDFAPQLVITTHSSHILDAVDFEKVRYFRRCCLEGEDPTKSKTLNASKVLNLRDFSPQPTPAEEKSEDVEETLRFLKRYLKLTHCDLFFADAAVLVEGTVEKLLLREMIQRSAKALENKYLTILEVGGAYASRFAGLLKFLGLSYLVITDIDSVDPGNGRKVCRADKEEAETSNSSLKYYFAKTQSGKSNNLKLSELKDLKPEEQIVADGNGYAAFQKPTPIAGHDEKPMWARTFEESFVYQNMQLFRDEIISLGVAIPGGMDHEKEYAAVFNRVKSPSFKKTQFALDIASSEADWETPEYIAAGLGWLEKVTRTESETESS